MGRLTKEARQEQINYREMELKRAELDKVAPPSYSIVLYGPEGATKNITITETEMIEIRRILLRGGD